ETLGAAGKPRQRAERKRNEPGQQPCSDGDPNRVEAPYREACRGAETRGGDRSDQGAELGRQLVISEHVRGDERPGADESPLGERRHPGKANAEAQPGGGEREISARSERVVCDQPAEDERSNHGEADSDARRGGAVRPTLTGGRHGLAHGRSGPHRSRLRAHSTTSRARSGRNASSTIATSNGINSR